MATIAVLGTFDSKGHEHAFLAQLIRERGHQTLLIDTGTLEPPQIQPDISRDEVARAAGLDLAAVAARKDRGECVAAMSKAAPVLLAQLATAGRIHGVISLGGGGGTAIGTAAMRALPIGFPKLMMSTLASGNVAPYVGTKDIVMFPSIVDVAGLNRISRTLLTRAAGAICGMVEASPPPAQDRPVIAASMFGNTTDCVQAAKTILEAAGYEVLVFHATGAGGRTMESLIESGLVAGVLDVTTTEWADELVGGILSAGPQRLDAAAKMGIPSVVAPGCLDMVNFGPPETVPTAFSGRNFYQHNPQVTLMRTTADECRQLGGILSKKINACTAPVTVAIPRRAISVISAPGGAFHDPAADQALFSSLLEGLHPQVAILDLECAINDAAFAQACAAALLDNIAATDANARTSRS
ncbi:MAG: Tm-1-like ATP-binding domain-containing protein [Verrucomicrobiales bacterium]|nr:Tm-1-like ATP-binding domain-containing protein [Verrucomicrobiales bacterium]